VHLRIISAVCCLLLCAITAPALGQELYVHEVLDRECKRMSALMKVARRLMVHSDELVASESQKAALEDLGKRAAEVVRRVRTSGGGPIEERKRFLDEILIAFKEIENELKEEILLPHQLDGFMHALFDRLLGTYGNSYTQLIKAQLFDELELSSGQKVEFEELRQSIHKEKEQIRKEFKNAIVEVEASSEKKLVEILTVEQINQFEKLAGKKLGEADTDLPRRMFGHTNKEDKAKARKKDEKPDD